MFRVATNNLVTLDVLQVVHENLLRKHVDERLDVGSHHVLVVSFLQLAKVAVWESRHEKLHVELISGAKEVHELLVGEKRSLY